MGKLSRSELVRKLARKAFKDCDVDQTGELILWMVNCFADKVSQTATWPPRSHQRLVLHDVVFPGSIDVKELHIALLLFYDLLNKVLFWP